MIDDLGYYMSKEDTKKIVGWQLKVADVDIVKLKAVSLEKNLVSSRRNEKCGVLRPGIKFGWLVIGELS